MHTPLSIPNNNNCQPHPWHPSVIYHEDGWNGHRFWMAQSPYPPFQTAPYTDYYEVPCIHYSDDGIHWTPISSNPIDNTSSEMSASHDYFSDPHLVLKDGILECYYRRTFLKNKQLVGNKTVLLKRTSPDGFKWSEAITVADLRTEQDVQIWGKQIISHSILWKNKQYYCWYVDRSSYLHNREIHLCTSTDGIRWTTHVKCELQSHTIDPWHIDVQYYDNMYQMVVYDMNGLSWFESSDGVHFRYHSYILRPSFYFMDFFSNGLYRACSVKVKQEIFLYFSAKNAQRTSIGLLKTTDRLTFSPKNGLSQLQYIKQYIYPQRSNKNLKRFIKHNLKKITNKT